VLVSDEWEPGASVLDRRRITVVSRGVESLLESLPIVAGRARRRQVLKTKGVRVMRLSFDAGQVLSERAENAPMLIQTLQGRVTLTVEGEQIDMPEGAVIHLERQLPHSIEAVEASHLMVTLLGPKMARPRAENSPAARSALGHAVTFRSPTQSGNARTSVTGRIRPEESSVPPEWAQHNFVLAATGVNSAAFDEITHRHAEFLGELATRTAALLDTLAGDGAADTAAAGLLAWIRASVLPHLLLEAEIFYPVVSLRPQQRPLVAVLEEELLRIVDAVDRLAEVTSGAKFELASAAVAVRVIIGRHLTAEAEVLLPTLAISSDESLAALWARMNERLRIPLRV
jgi:quercetin dioxygenase-like cupin family protein